MMSLRAAARFAPRSVARAGSASITPSITRSMMASQRIGVVRAAQVHGLRRSAAAFSTSAWCRKAEAEAANETDAELMAKLQTEIEFETDSEKNEPQPASVKDFLDNGLFELVDVPGKEKVTLTRTFGDEKIIVTFSIADLQSYDPDEFNDDDPALGDEELENERPQGEEAGEGGEGAEDGMGSPPVSVRLNVVVEKPGKGALNILASAQDGNIMVENFYYYHDAKLAHGETADLSHASENLYPGPQFGSLDEDLQILLERYLEERGISQAMALFVPDYMEIKEQKEYLSWLSNVKGFITA